MYRKIGRGQVIKMGAAGGVVVVAGLFLGPTAVTNRAHGQTGCSAASLSGPYGIEGWGSIGGAPAAFVGTVGFDGQGNSTAGSLVLTLGGTIDHIASTATYKVDASCNGTMLIKTAHSNPPRTHYHNIDMVVVDGGREVYFMVGGPINSPAESPPPGEVLNGFLKRQ
jgi:hypothetical protein